MHFNVSVYFYGGNYIVKERVPLGYFQENQRKPPTRLMDPGYV